MSPDHPKPSFAKVAASVSAEDPAGNTSQRPTTSNENHGNMDIPPPAAGPVIANGGLTQTHQPTLLSQSGNEVATPGKALPVDRVTGSLGDLNLQPKCPAPPGGMENNSAPIQRPQVISRESGASDGSQKADSSSELGTKPPSLDGKSITSGTTFALDEKESLRPDDSASVKAAGEDDDSFSIRGSLVAGSRMGSDLAARARGIQLGDMPDRRLMQVTPGSSGHGILTPQSASSEQQPRAGAEMPALAPAEGPSDALNLIYRHAPDDKLIEAMRSSKDRLYLLKLEKDVIDFVQNSKEPFMDLPPSNSFCRMLAHKLADYYHMTHSFERNIGVVRIFRTPFCRVPASLAHWDPAPNPSNNSTPPPAVMPKKIMRRGQDGDAGPVSAAPSKPTSEAGSDSKENKEKPQNSQKLTREEREEMYKLARERIFGSADDSTTDADGDNNVSRTSSVSANNKCNPGKGRRNARHRRDDSDSFDSRNHYAPYWGPQQQTWVPQFTQPPGGQMAAQSPTAYGTQMPHVYGQQTAGYPGMPTMAPNPNYPVHQTPQYPPQPPQQRYPVSGSPMTSYGSPVSGAAQQQSWQPGFNPYQGRGGPPTAPPMQPGIPYAFGQLPANANPNDPKSQHPIPGSYNRNHNFNPKTQSFVPGGNGMPPAPTPQPPFTAPASHHGSPQVGSTQLAYPGCQQGIPQPYAGGHGMVRQASNNSVPGYHTPQHMQAPYGQHPPHPTPNPHHPPIQHANPNQATHIPSRPNVPQQGPNHPFNHLPTYGNPATLPQKPATGI